MAEESTGDQPKVVEDTSTASTLFDLRTVIAILFGSFGVILLIVALTTTTQAELDKAGGVHINLWTSIAMLVLSAVFAMWVRTRPTLGAAADEADTTNPSAG